MSFTAETARRQDEWSAALSHTVRDLAKATKQAAKSYEDYRVAVANMGQLYAYCGQLMASANAPAMAMTESFSEADEAQTATARVVSATEQWRRSTEEANTVAFLAEQAAVWQQCRQEMIRTQQHNKARKEVLHVLDEVSDQLDRLLEKNSTSSSSSSASRAMVRLEVELCALREEAEQHHVKVERDMRNHVRGFSRALIHSGTQLSTVMTASGHNAVSCFQPPQAAMANHFQSQPRAAGAANAGRHSSFAVPATEKSDVSSRLTADHFPLARPLTADRTIAQLATPRCSSTSSVETTRHAL